VELQHLSGNVSSRVAELQRALEALRGDPADTPNDALETLVHALIRAMAAHELSGEAHPRLNHLLQECRTLHPFIRHSIVRRCKSRGIDRHSTLDAFDLHKARLNGKLAEAFLSPARPT